ncbi:reverse transcriptase [Lasius niger]|uniref:Reverse transcriptase n=1 Tax=Lasius niger TaxID=67767 RepID=A0A0J7JW29_LASNI|nr:reverse transcriptase [Lasius niger]
MCVRKQGSSIVDVTMGSPGIARMIGDWKVDDNTESLFDHRYIKMSLTLHYMPDSGQSLKKDIDEDIKHLEDTLTQTCDLAMPKMKSVKKRLPIGGTITSRPLGQLAYLHGVNTPKSDRAPMRMTKQC